MGFRSATNVVIDTHYTQRGRMGRLFGVLARAVEDSGNRAIVGIGLDQKTGIVIRNGIAEVIGTGEAAFIQESESSVLRRDAGRPLFYTDLQLDRLTEGWMFDLVARRPLTSVLPAGVVAVSYPGAGASNSGALAIDGNLEADANRFERLAAYAPSDYALLNGTGVTVIKSTLGFTRAGSSASRAAKQETLFRALFAQPDHLAIAAFSGGTLSRLASSPDSLAFGGTLASIVIDGKTCSYKGLSPSVSS